MRLKRRATLRRWDIALRHQFRCILRSKSPMLWPLPSRMLFSAFGHWQVSQLLFRCVYLLCFWELCYGCCSVKLTVSSYCIAVIAAFIASLFRLCLLFPVAEVIVLWSGYMPGLVLLGGHRPPPPNIFMAPSFRSPSGWSSWGRFVEPQFATRPMDAALSIDRALQQLRKPKVGRRMVVLGAPKQFGIRWLSGKLWVKYPMIGGHSQNHLGDQQVQMRRLGERWCFPFVQIDSTNIRLLCFSEFRHRKLRRFGYRKASVFKEAFWSPWIVKLLLNDLFSPPVWNRAMELLLSKWESVLFTLKVSTEIVGIFLFLVCWTMSPHADTSHFDISPHWCSLLTSPLWNVHFWRGPILCKDDAALVTHDLRGPWRAPRYAPRLCDMCPPLLRWQHRPCLRWSRWEDRQRHCAHNPAPEQMSQSLWHITHCRLP